MTPSYNQSRFLEGTIRSVLLQHYPNLEYFVMDGGSTDGSVDIVRKYEPWLTGWVSERDRGQTDAINKGFQRCSGEILAYLNSDDRLAPGALHRVAEIMRDDAAADILHGDCDEIDESEKVVQRCRFGPFFLDRFITGSGSYLYQPAMFWRRSVWETCGPMDVDCHYAMDTDLWLRAAVNHRFRYVPETLAQASVQQDRKTARVNLERFAEVKRIWDRFFALPNVSTEILRLKPTAYRYLVRCAMVDSIFDANEAVLSDYFKQTWQGRLAPEAETAALARFLTSGTIASTGAAASFRTLIKIHQELSQFAIPPFPNWVPSRSARLGIELASMLAGAGRPSPARRLLAATLGAYPHSLLSPSAWKTAAKVLLK